MTKVFVGGSRRITRLSKDAKSELDRIIQNEYLVLVGDANGADKSIQKYLFNKNYEKVTVFCVESSCRNNIGHWQTKNIKAPTGNRDFVYYSSKDLAMVKEADYGFMLWDAKSKGTLNNVLNLLREDKKTIVYLSPERRLQTLNKLSDVGKIISSCDQKSIEWFEKQLNCSGLVNLSTDSNKERQLSLI